MARPGAGLFQSSRGTFCPLSGSCFPLDLHLLFWEGRRHLPWVLGWAVTLLSVAVCLKQSCSAGPLLPVRSHWCVKQARDPRCWVCLPSSGLNDFHSLPPGGSCKVSRAGTGGACRGDPMLPRLPASVLPSGPRPHRVPAVRRSPRGLQTLGCRTTWKLLVREEDRGKHKVRTRMVLT